MKSNAALAAVIVVLLLAGFVSPVKGPQDALAAQPPGILVPLYSAPGSQWNELIAAKTANPSVPMIAIINPSNGPGPSSDQAFQQGVQGLKNAGVIVVGYVATGYGSQPTSTIEGWVSEYQQWYGVSGIFFDEMADTLGYQLYYQTLGTFVTSHSMQYTIGNPGTTLPGAFAGLLGIYVVAEDSYAVAPGSLTGAVGIDPASSLGAILSSVPSTNQTYVDSLLSSAGWIYLTDQGAPDPYVILSSYFGNLVDMAAKASGVASTTEMVTIDSIDAGGSPLPGFWTTVASNGVSIATGNTPLTFSAESGQTYQVTSSNSGLDVLTQWSTGATANTISLDTQQNIVIAAIYSLGPTVKVDVQTVADNGSAMSGLWTTINQGASLIASGYTPVTFSVAPGTQYNVTVANFANLVFNHWGTGQTTSSLLFTPSGDTTLTAFFGAAAPSTSSSSSGSPSASSSTSSSSGQTTTVTTTVTVPGGGGGGVVAETSTTTVTTTQTEEVTTVQTETSIQTQKVTTTYLETTTVNGTVTTLTTSSVATIVSTSLSPTTVTRTTTQTRVITEVQTGQLTNGSRAPSKAETQTAPSPRVGPMLFAAVVGGSAAVTGLLSSFMVRRKGSSGIARSISNFFDRVRRSKSE